MVQLPGRFLALLLFLLSTAAFAQQGQRAQPPDFPSPEVGDDRTIAFRVYAPEAKSARVSSSDLPNANPFGPGIEMTKDDKGV